jgi:hypothetical protein
MTKFENEKEFEAFVDEHYRDFLKDKELQFERVFNRNDLEIFYRLDKLFPSEEDIVCAAEHDEIFLNITISDILTCCTKEEFLDLIRLGVRVSDWGNLRLPV